MKKQSITTMRERWRRANWLPAPALPGTNRRYTLNVNDKKELLP